MRAAGAAALLRLAAPATHALHPTPELIPMARRRIDPIFGPSGQALRDRMLAEREYTAVEAELVTRCCRIVDRLDILDRLIMDDPEWMKETRQQENTLRQIHATLAAGAPSTQKEETDGVDELLARRAQRRGAS